MKSSHSFLSKICSILTLIAFLAANTGFAENLDYVPFDGDQEESAYLTPEQLDNLGTAKQSLVDKYNSENNPDLSSESEIVEYLYDLMKPADLASLNTLKSSYETSKLERETAESEYNTLKDQLKDYYTEEENARINLQNILNQISIFTSRLNSVLSEKQKTDDKLAALETEIAGKKSALTDGKYKDIPAAESELDDLKDELASLISQRDASDEEREMYEAELDVEAAQDDFDAALDLVRQALGDDFDLDTSSYDKILDGDGNLIGVSLTPNDPDSEELIFDALQKREVLDDANNAYEQLKTDYETAHPATNADDAIDDYKAILAGIPEVEQDIHDQETDVLSKYEEVRLAEVEINNVQSEIDTTNSKYNLLASTADSLMNEIDSMNAARIQMEDELRRAMSDLNQAEDASGLKEAETDYLTALEAETVSLSRFENALKERSEFLSALNKTDKALQAALLSALAKENQGIAADEEFTLPENASAEDIQALEEALNRFIFGQEDAVLMVNGRIVDTRANIETVKATLRNVYIKVFNADPDANLINACADIATRTKMPSIRILEVLKKIHDMKLEIKDEKLESEKDLVKEELTESGSSLLSSLAERLNAQNADPVLINGILSYLASPVISLVNCGVMALGKMFEAIGQSFSAGQATEEALLTDIMNGALNITDEGGLSLSLSALQKAAEANGTGLIGQAVSAGDLGKVDGPFIAHFSEGHYVMAKGVKDGSVEFFDPATGADSSMSVSAFSRSYSGYVLALHGVEGGRVLGSGEMKDIFGAATKKSSSKSSSSRSIFSSISKAVSSAVSKAVSTVSKAVSSVASSVSKAVSSAVSKAVSSVSSAVSSAAKSVSSAVSSAVSSVSKAVSSAVSSSKSSGSSSSSSSSSSRSSSSPSSSSSSSKSTPAAAAIFSPAAFSLTTPGTSSATLPSCSTTGSQSSTLASKPAAATAPSSGSGLNTRHSSYSGNVQAQSNPLTTFLNKITQGSGQPAANTCAAQPQGTSSANAPSLKQSVSFAGFGSAGVGMSSPLSSFFNKPQVATNVTGDQNKNLTVPVNGTCSVPDAQQGTSSLYPSKNQTVYTPAQAGRNTQNMCIDPNLANLRSDGRANAIAGMSPQNPSNIASYSPVISGAGLGLWTGLKYMPQVPEKELVQPTLNQFINKKDLSKALPDVIRKVKNFPDGQIPKEGLKLDFGSGRISPHDAKNVLGISRFELTDPGLSPAQIKSVKYVPKSPTIVTYQNVENSELQVLKYLDEQGFKTSKIYYENVPALPGQRAETFKLFDNVLKPGGKIELTPRSAEIQNAFSEKNLVNARSYADDIANELKNSVKGNIVGQPSYTPRLAHPKVEILSADNVFKYTIQKADDVDNSLLAAAGKEGALMSKVAKTTGFMKTAVTKAAPVVRYAVPILIVAGIVLDGIDLYNAYQKDKEEGGYRNTVETSGKIAGTWAGGLAGAKIGAVAGFCIGGPIGAAIGAVAGGIVGGLIGAYAGKEIASTGYDIATGEGPVTNTRVPMHETISTQYEYSPAITMPEGFNNNFDASYFMPNNITLDYGATSQALQGTISYDASPDIALQPSR